MPTLEIDPVEVSPDPKEKRLQSLPNDVSSRMSANKNKSKRSKDAAPAVTGAKQKTLASFFGTKPASQSNSQAQKKLRLDTAAPKTAQFSNSNSIESNLLSATAASIIPSYQKPAKPSSALTGSASARDTLRNIVLGTTLTAYCVPSKGNIVDLTDEKRDNGNNTDLTYNSKDATTAELPLETGSENNPIIASRVDEMKKPHDNESRVLEVTIIDVEKKSRPDQSTDANTFSVHKKDASCREKSINKIESTPDTEKRCPTDLSTKNDLGNDTCVEEVVVVELPTNEMKGKSGTSYTTNCDENIATLIEDAELSPDQLGLLQKHEELRQKYRIRGMQLLQQAKQGLPGEKFDKDTYLSIELTETEPSVFPQTLKPVLAYLVEGSPLPLSHLSKEIYTILVEKYSLTGVEESVVTIAIPEIAQRIQYIKAPNVLEGRTIPKLQAVDLFADTLPEHMWRWEVSVTEYWPSNMKSVFQKARAERRQLSKQWASILKLWRLLSQADKLVQDNASLSDVNVKISQQIEIISKFERQKEKQRVEEESKRKKQEMRKENTEEMKRKKQEIKKQQMEEKKALQEKEKREKELRKQAAKAEHERLKASEKEEMLKKEVIENERKKKLEAMQQNLMQSFLAKSKSSTPFKDIDKLSVTVVNSKDTCHSKSPTESAVDREDTIRANIQAQRVDSSLVDSLRSSTNRRRCRRTGPVTISVTVTVTDDDNWGVTYAEKRNVQVNNKYRFFRFVEDVRPPYYGTWSKKSKSITGRNPLGKDKTHLDYDVDSEGEWEEGDDEIGEDVEEDNGDEEEEEKEDAEEAEDNWLAADDEIECDDDDDEKVYLRNKQLAQTSVNRVESTLYSISPNLGIPISLTRALPNGNASSDFVHNISIQSATELVSKYNIIVLQDKPIYLDAFPPQLTQKQPDKP